MPFQARLNVSKMKSSMSYSYDTARMARYVIGGLSFLLETQNLRNQGTFPDCRLSMIIATELPG